MLSDDHYCVYCSHLFPVFCCSVRDRVIVTARVLFFSKRDEGHSFRDSPAPGSDTSSLHTDAAACEKSLALSHILTHLQLPGLLDVDGVECSRRSSSACRKRVGGFSISFSLLREGRTLMCGGNSQHTTQAQKRFVERASARVSHTAIRHLRGCVTLCVFV